MRIAGLFLSLLLSVSLAAQRVDRTPICDADTIEVNHRNLKFGEPLRYRAITCVQPSQVGLRIELGAAGFRYTEATRSLLGNHGSGLLGLGLVHGNWTAAIRLKVWTVEPRRVLLADNDTLNPAAKLNPVKVDYTLGYSFNLPHQFSLEPFLGYTRHRFFVINEEDLNKDLDFRTAKGFTAGLTAHKYFPTKYYTFLGLFVRLAYASTDFSKLHPSLGSGYWEGAAGIALKGFSRITYLKRVSNH